METASTPANSQSASNSRRSRRWFLGVLIFVVLAAVPFWFISHRNQQMDQLYAQATGQPGYWTNSSEPDQAVRKLAGFHGERSTQMLLDIALGNNDMAIFSNAQIEAIKALRDRRGEPEIGTELASLLQPHVALGVRQAAAHSLENLPCKRECIDSILYYLERAQRGELRDDVLLPSNAAVTAFDDQIKADIHKDEEAIATDLYAVLRREKQPTFLAFQDVYGIGSTRPSLFALDLLPRLPFPEACSLLLRSANALAPFPPQFFQDTRQALKATISSLNCH